MHEVPWPAWFLTVYTALYRLNRWMFLPWADIAVQKPNADPRRWRPRA